MEAGRAEARDPGPAAPDRQTRHTDLPAQTPTRRLCGQQRVVRHPPCAGRSAGHRNHGQMIAAMPAVTATPLRAPRAQVRGRPPHDRGLERAAGYPKVVERPLIELPLQPLVHPQPVAGEAAAADVDPLQHRRAAGGIDDARDDIEDVHRGTRKHGREDRLDLRRRPTRDAVVEIDLGRVVADGRELRAFQRWRVEAHEAGQALLAGVGVEQLHTHAVQRGPARNDRQLDARIQAIALVLRIWRRGHELAVA
jgi:hypothetical protein